MIIIILLLLKIGSNDGLYRCIWKENYHNSHSQQFLTEIFKMFDLTNEKEIIANSLIIQ